MHQSLHNIKYVSLKHALHTEGSERAFINDMNILILFSLPYEVKMSLLLPCKYTFCKTIYIVIGSQCPRGRALCSNHKTPPPWPPANQIPDERITCPPPAYNITTFNLTTSHQPRSHSRFASPPRPVHRFNLSLTTPQPGRQNGHQPGK